MSPEEFDEVSRMVGPAEIDTVVRITSQPGAGGVEPQLAFPLFSPLQTYLRHLSKHLRTRLFTTDRKSWGSRVRLGLPADVFSTCLQAEG